MPEGGAHDGGSSRRSEDKETPAVEPHALPDDPVPDPADEVRRRAAFDAAMAGIDDATIAGHVELLVGIGISAWDFDEAFASDLAHEALTRVLEHRRKWDPRRGELYPFLKGVLRGLADDYFDSAAFRYEAHLQRPHDGGDTHGLESDPESTIDEYENLPPPAAGSGGYTLNPEQLVSAQQTWEQDTADFLAVREEFAEDKDARRVIVASQKDLVTARAQAENAKIPVKRIYDARRRISRFLVDMYKARDEKPRLERVAVRPTRRAGEGAKMSEVVNKDGLAPGSTDANGERGPVAPARGTEKVKP